MPLDPSRARALDLTSLGEFVADDHVVEAIRATRRDLLRTDGQPIEQLRLARTCELLTLTGRESVLLAGARPAWHAAVLARLACWVVVVDADESRCQRIKTVLRRAGRRNVTVLHGDPLTGFEDAAPYDAIVMGEGAESLRVPEALTNQLTHGGCLILPGREASDRLLLCHRRGEFRELDSTSAPLVEGTAIS